MIIVIDNRCTNVPTVYFQKLIDCLRTNHVAYRVIKTMQDFEGIKEGATSYILSGSPTHIHEMSKEHHALNAAAIRSGRPVLGICFGAQFICSYFGGQLVRMDRFLCASRIIYTVCPDKFRARFCARYRIGSLTKSCAPTHFADIDGQKAVIVGFRHRTRPIYATLFHPEYFEHTHAMILNFIRT